MVLEPSSVGQGGKSDCGKRVLLKRSSGYVGGWQYCVLSVADVLTRVSACGVGRQKSTVLEADGWRRMLKGPLWWLVIALLVGGTLANQANESIGVTDPPSAMSKDGRCWELCWLWWCLSWGTGHVPSSVCVSEIPEDTLVCDTVRCYAQKGADLEFDMLGLFF